MKQIISFFLSVLLFSGCIPKQSQQVKLQGETQGTYYVVTYYDKAGKNYQEEIEQLLADFDQVASMWVPNSLISRVNRNEISSVEDPYFKDLYQMSEEIFIKSGGAFDPTIGPLVNAWGFGFTDRMEVDQAVVDSLLPLVGFDRIKLKEGTIYKEDERMQFDFNAVAQGYSVDLIGRLLEDRGIENYLVDVGGEVLARGQKPGAVAWKVGIEKPSDHAGYGESLEAIVTLNNRAMATSGNYRKFYEENGVRYSHTIDPRTGYPVQHSLLSVSVMANDCATADAWATACMVMGFEKAKTVLEKNTELEAFFIYNEKGSMKTFFTEGMAEYIVENE